MDKKTNLLMEKMMHTMTKNTDTSHETCKHCGGPGSASFSVSNEFVDGYCSQECANVGHRSKENTLRRHFPKRYIDSTFDNFITGPNAVAIEKLKSIPDDFTDNIFIYGSSGNGKTHLAVALLKKMFIGGNDVRFSTATSMLISLRESFSDKSDKSELDLLTKYSSIGILLIDDIGAEKVTDYVMQSWYSIINTRYNIMRPTIFTSNLSIPDIAKTLGDRIASRMASGLVIKIDGKDVRLTKNERGQK